MEKGVRGGDLSTGGAPRTLHTLELDLFAWFSLGKMVALDPKKADSLRSLPEEFLPQINKSCFCSSFPCPVPPS